MNQGQATGESLQSSARDAERGSSGQRRTHSSSGFLVDSFVPRSRSFRASNKDSRRSEPEHREKRGALEADATPKKRSRFRWTRQRGSERESDTIKQDVTDDKRITVGLRSPQDTMKPDSRGESATTHTGSREESLGDNHATAGLDKDSLQIVNLALNLSELRRRGNVSYNPPNRISGGAWASSADGQTSAGGSIPSHGSHSGHHTNQSIDDDRVKSLRSQGASMSTNNVLNSLPPSATSDSVPQGFLGGTLARAANARRYFELRHEYLRLLTFLPPLAPHAHHSTTDSSRDLDAGYPLHRVYNPIQAIRNRKVRFRERCPLDPEADGWNEIDKVHNWVNSVEAGYSHQARSHIECLKLPRFQRAIQEDLPSKSLEYADTSAVSPPSSLRRVSRTGSLKARRARSDWVIYPDELLADAAWVEEVQNKSRIVDKDGNILYPQPRSLIVNDSHQKQVQASAGRPSSHTSVSDARRSLSVDLNDYGRGRQQRRFRTSRRIGRSSSASEQDLGSKRHHLKVRSRSSSSSSADSRQYPDSMVSSAKSPRKSVSPLRRKGTIWSEKRGSLSSVPSADDRYDPLSMAMMESRGSNPAKDIGYFPSIASNLSAPSSRSSSPPKRGFSRAIGSQRVQSRNGLHRKGVDDESSDESDAVRKDSLTEQDSLPDIEPTRLSSQASTSHQESQTKTNPHERKDSVQHESKLRGIFKGPGKIAGKVGNEVSKMGDLILGKDGLVHSRKPYFAISDESEFDEETRNDKRAIPRAILRRLPTFSDDTGRPSPRNSDKSLAKSSATPLSLSVSPRQSPEGNSHKAPNLTYSQGRLLDLQSNESREVHALGLHQGKSTVRSIAHRLRPLEFGPEIHTVREEIKKGRIKDSSVPFSIARPPITGLAQAQPTPVSSPHEKCPTLSGQTRSWSISDRSISISIESGVPGKQEVERTRALLLSSGIKAREIARQVEGVRSHPHEFLQRSFSPDTSIPSVPRLYEHELASRRLLKRIESSHSSLQNSIQRVPKAAFLPLKSQLFMLEDLINKSLNPRVHAAAEEAENLSMQLNTTSTLAVKRLSETLDHGIRKRHRRLRWLRRTGFVMLEWALIGLLWWVWLIVVAFKLLRKLLHGMISGVRWVLWL